MIIFFILNIKLWNHYSKIGGNIMDLEKVLAYFIIYAVGGWMLEVAYAAYREKKFVNRGMLNGPVCPIYGFGVILVLLLLEPLNNNIPVLFIASVIVCSVLEYFTGFLLEKLLNTRWWDYSDVKYNLSGYICLSFSIYWGLFCVIIVHFIQPSIARFVGIINTRLLLFMLIVAYALLLIDFAVTAQTLYKLRLKLVRMDKIAKDMKVLSNDLGYRIYERTMKVEGLIEENKSIIEKLETDLEQFINKLEERREHRAEEIENAKSRFKEIRNRIHGELDIKIPGLKRLFHAFPTVRSERHREALAEIKNRVNRVRNK